jgi:hypothetical protein
MIRSDVSVVALSSLFAALLVGCGCGSTRRRGARAMSRRRTPCCLDLPRADYDALRMGEYDDRWVDGGGDDDRWFDLGRFDDQRSDGG